MRMTMDTAHFTVCQELKWLAVRIANKSKLLLLPASVVSTSEKYSHRSLCVLVRCGACFWEALRQVSSNCVGFSLRVNSLRGPYGRNKKYFLRLLKNICFVLFTAAALLKVAKEKQNKEPIIFLALLYLRPVDILALS